MNFRFFIVCFSLACMGFTANAEEVYSVAQVESAALDARTMNILMSVRLGNPCDHVAPPQVAQNAADPTLIVLKALERQSDHACIDKTSDKVQTVNLPSLLEMSDLKISKAVTYRIVFEGSNAELIVPGKNLVISIQPQPQPVLE